jgi:NAD(P)-dependent dehydrogenase (short-subunit alcohol dehydrogenase family)
MKILVTGNPHYDGLCSGINKVLDNVDFIGRWNGWNMTDFDAIAEKAKDYEVFVNSQFGPNDIQLHILNAVYDKFEKGHIINIGSSSAYWKNGSPQDYIETKSKLEDRSKELSNHACWANKPIRVSCIAYGQLNSQSQKQRDSRQKIDLVEAAKVIKWIIESPAEYNLHYVALDPIQTTN